MSWTPTAKLISDISIENTADQHAASDFSISIPNRLSFKWEDLVLCVGRTQMLSTARSNLTSDQREKLVRDVSVAIMTHLSIFIDSPVVQFAFTALLDELADEERTSLASKVGAAITDLLMERSGYRFRANARELTFSRSSQRPLTRTIPDFVYDDAKDTNAGSRAIVVEAKGSLSKFRATKGRLVARANKAYEEQILILVGETASDGTKVSGGCAVAFGAIPGQKSSTLVTCSSNAMFAGFTPLPTSSGAGALGARVARSLSAASSALQPMRQPHVEHQQQQQQPIKIETGQGGIGQHRHGGGREEGRGSNGRIAFANYETIFRLCGAKNAANAIRNSLNGASQTHVLQKQAFAIYPSQPLFLFSMAKFAPCWSSGYFAIYRPVAEEILKSLAANRQSPPTTLWLSDITPDLAASDPPIHVHSDGLAWFNDISGSPTINEWDLSVGDW